MEIKQPAVVNKISFKCPKCYVGYMWCVQSKDRLVYSFGKPNMRPGITYMHVCTYCGFKAVLPISYPYVRIDVEDEEALKQLEPEGSA